MGSLLLTIENDSELIEEYLESKSEIAANTFVRKYQKFVFATAFRYLKNNNDAEDATQEAFIKALGNLHKFRKESSLNTWLYRIVSNISKNMLRKRKVMSIFSYKDETEEFYDIASSEPNPEKQFENKEFEAKFLKALDSLPAKQRETFALRYYEELPYEEISKMLGTSVGGLKANYFQAVKKLGKLLKGEKNG
jgi:RNA polymerase sigma-70 factor (ECF subfamily)